MGWTLQAGAVSRPISDWEISHPRLSLESQAADRFAFSCPNEDLDADPQFPYGMELQLFDDAGTRRFVGKIRELSEQLGGSQRLRSYRAFNAWWDLENLSFLKTIKTQIPGSLDLFTTGTARTTHLLLNWDAINQVQISQAAQIIDVLTVAQAKGVALAPGSILAFADERCTPPIYETRDALCSQVILDQLRFTPSAVLWVDYAAAIPTLNAVTRAHMAAASLAFGDQHGEAYRLAASLTPRYDLQRGKVALRFEVNGTHQGQPYLQFIDEVWPAAAYDGEVGDLVQTISLRGPSSGAAETVQFVTAALDLEDIDWWKARVPVLQEARITGLRIVAGTVGRSGELGLPYELLEGQIPDWLGAAVEEEDIACKVSFTLNGVSGEWEEVELGLQIKTCSIVGGIYSRAGAYSLGDPLPLDAARLLYDQCSPLHYEGEVVIAEKSAGAILTPSRLHLGMVLNLTAGPARYAAMNAIIQAIDIDLLSAVTTLKLGPPNQVGYQELVELLQ